MVEFQKTEVVKEVKRNIIFFTLKKRNEFSNCYSRNRRICHFII